MRGDDTHSAAEQGSSTQTLGENAGSETYTGAAFDTSYERALAASSQLAIMAAQGVELLTARVAE